MLHSLYTIRYIVQWLGYGLSVPGFESCRGKFFFQNVLSWSGTNPASYSVCTGFYSRAYNVWGVMNTPSNLEFITNLMHNFIYSIMILHHDPQHVSSIAVLIFRATIVYLQYLVSSHSVCCHTVHRSRADCSIHSVTIPDTVNIQLSPWRRAQRCSKHVEDHDVISLLNK
jgi:hypothetical protein